VADSSKPGQESFRNDQNRSSLYDSRQRKMLRSKSLQASALQGADCPPYAASKASVRPWSSVLVILVLSWYMCLVAYLVSQKRSECSQVQRYIRSAGRLCASNPLLDCVSPFRSFGKTDWHSHVLLFSCPLSQPSNRRFKSALWWATIS
jgi:hypothetical protein